MVETCKLRFASVVVDRVLWTFRAKLDYIMAESFVYLKFQWLTHEGKSRALEGRRVSSKIPSRVQDG